MTWISLCVSMCVRIVNTSVMECIIINPRQAVNHLVLNPNTESGLHCSCWQRGHSQWILMPATWPYDNPEVSEFSLMGFCLFVCFFLSHVGIGCCSEVKIAVAKWVDCNRLIWAPSTPSAEIKLELSLHLNVHLSQDIIHLLLLMSLFSREPPDTLPYNSCECVCMHT